MIHTFCNLKEIDQTVTKFSLYMLKKFTFRLSSTWLIITLLEMLNLGLGYQQNDVL